MFWVFFLAWIPCRDVLLAYSGVGAVLPCAPRPVAGFHPFAKFQNHSKRTGCSPLARLLPEHRPANLLAEEEVFSHSARLGPPLELEPRAAHRAPHTNPTRSLTVSAKDAALPVCVCGEVPYSANGESRLPAGD